jgi:hypothetical protein
MISTYVATSERDDVAICLSALVLLLVIVVDPLGPSVILILKYLKRDLRRIKSENAQSIEGLE